jgi:stage II sporulation protein D
MSWAALGLLWCAAGGVDLERVMAGRTGAAVVEDLAEGRRVGVWNEKRVKGRLVRPGSVLKPFTLAAAIEAGRYRGDGSAEEALAVSSNEYFEGLAARLEAGELERGYARFGLEARAGTMTLEQLVGAYKRLVRRHREARLRPVFAGMERAVEYGTARLAGTGVVKVAGKTGTTSTTALFVGYAPVERPRYLVVIQLDRGSGGGDAAPFAAKVFAELFARREVEDGRVSVRLYWANPPRQLNLAPGEYAEGTWIETGRTRLRAPGPLRVEQRDGKYLLTARVAREDYVAAVVAGEAGGLRQSEAKKAMAVAARSYAAYFRRRHAEEGFDFCDTTHCQDARFGGEGAVGIVEETAGEMIWWQGRPAAAYYHADSGGWLEASGEGPYLRARQDAWWEDTAAGRWEWKTTVGDLAAGLGLALVRPQVKVLEREKSGRVKAIDVLGRGAEGVAFRTLVGRAMGWEKLPSRLFTVEQEGRAVVFRGRGRGHGLGLAQTSAERMAAAGKRYEEILAEYYPGTKVGVTASGMRWRQLRTGRVTVWTTEVERDRGLPGLVERELGKLEEMVGMRVEPVVRVYPSREAFRDATGILSPVAGATRGRRVYLPPGAALGTLRHELLHAVLESNTTMQHEGWLREGLVEALLGEESEAARRVKRMIAERGLKEVLEMWRTGKGR